MGMKHAIMELFPDKKVYGVGTHPSYLPSFIEEADQISDEVIENSLAVVVDVSDSYRVEDQRFLKPRRLFVSIIILNLLKLIFLSIE